MWRIQLVTPPKKPRIDWAIEGGTFPHLPRPLDSSGEARGRTLCLFVRLFIYTNKL